jgi:hypothetical protein
VVTQEPLALIAPEPRKAHCGKDFPGLALLLARDRERTLEIGFRFNRISLGRPQGDLPGNAIAGCSGDNHRFVGPKTL